MNNEAKLYLVVDGAFIPVRSIGEGLNVLAELEREGKIKR